LETEFVESLFMHKVYLRVWQIENLVFLI
jgi:hypothetical protein